MVVPKYDHNVKNVVELINTSLNDIGKAYWIHCGVFLTLYP